MKNSVSISEFRENLALYLRLAKYKGESVRIVDEKIGEPVGELNPVKIEADWDEYLEFVKSMKGDWKDLPEDKYRRIIKKRGIRKLKKMYER